MAESDDFIHADVTYMLNANPLLPRHSVTAQVENGWVTLLGCVDWPFLKAAAESGILDYSGAIGVTNQIAVKPDCEVDTQWIKHFQSHP